MPFRASGPTISINESLSHPSQDAVCNPFPSSVHHGLVIRPTGASRSSAIDPGSDLVATQQLPPNVPSSKPSSSARNHHRNHPRRKETKEGPVSEQPRGTPSSSSNTDIASTLIALKRRQHRAAENSSEKPRSSHPHTIRNYPSNPTSNDSRSESLADTKLSSSSTRPSVPAAANGNSSSGRRSRQPSAQPNVTDSRHQDHIRSDSHQRPSSSSRRERPNRSFEPRSSLAEDFTATKDGRQLFDPRRHDPVKFAKSQINAQQQQQPTDALLKNSTPHLSSSQTLSSRDHRSAHAATTTKSTSESTTTSSFADSNNAQAALQGHVSEIKKVYRNICAHEAKLQQAHRTESERQRELAAESQNLVHVDQSYWLKITLIHRQLAEFHSSFLELTLRPDLPRSVQELPEVYNIPSRLWQTGFHLMLERLRHNLPVYQQHPADSAQPRSDLLDHLTEFIYFAYSFYTTLLETERFKCFKRAWIESLGDLSRYRMAVAGLAASLSIEVEGAIRNKPNTTSPKPSEARIDDAVDPDNHQGQGLAGDFDKASIGSAALGDWEWVEKETWRQTARDWYARGLAEAPGVGRLHHHLGILSRDEELRALYHFCRSLTVTRPFSSAKETILSLFDQQRQFNRRRNDCTVQDLFLCLHGMLITKIQLDDFEDVFSQFRHKLIGMSSATTEGRNLPCQSDWMMLAFINIAGILQYGSEDSVILDTLLQRGKGSRKLLHTERTKSTTPTAIIVNQSGGGRNDDSHLNELPRDPEWEDGSDDQSDNGDDAHTIQLENKNDEGDLSGDLPQTLVFAIKLAFFMLEFSLTHNEPPSGLQQHQLKVGPYATVMLTFFLSITRSRKVLRMVERYFPWHRFVDLLNKVQTSMKDHHHTSTAKEAPSCFISSKMSLPEDWCLRGTTGISRQTYDRSLWKACSNSSCVSSSSSFQTELEMLDSDESELYERFDSLRTAADGQTSRSLDHRRMQRAVFVAHRLAKSGKEIDFESRTHRFVLSRPHAVRLAKWKAEEEERHLEFELEKIKLEQQQSSGTGTSAALRLEAEPKHASSDWDSDDFDDEDDDGDDAALDGEPEQMKALRMRKRYLKSVLHTATARLADGSATKKGGNKKSHDSRRRKATAVRPHMVAGYTILIVDTNLIVTPGQLIQQLVESEKWTVIVPLAVITELDGLSRNTNDLGDQATQAIRFLESHIRSHAKWMKVQTSRGNYLSDLSIRSEDIDFGLESNEDDKSFSARNVDEVILRSLSWQTEHFVDRLHLISNHLEKDRSKVKNDTQKAMLLTLDRNLRLKAKARGLASLDESGITDLMMQTISTSHEPNHRDRGS